jgi:hypothetical protein
LIFCKRAAPAIGEIKDGYVEHEHGIVAMGAPSKKLAHPLSGIVLTMFRVHGDLVFL